MQSSRLPACARIGRSGTPYATLSDGMLASDSDGLPVALSFEDTLAMPDGYYLSVPTETFPLGE